MSGLNNLKPNRVIRAFERDGWKIERRTGSHIILSKRGKPGIISIPVHKGKPIKQGLLRKQIEIAGMSIEDFLNFYR
ncbi:MAG: type II toxin-antitoxin system HicA family toxin [Thermodesulfobacteriota bacterium]